MKKYLALLILLLCPTLLHAYSSSGWFEITQTFSTTESNMQYRVYGMPNVQECSNGQNWAYVDEADSGARTKISTLLSAYAAGHQVQLTLEVVDYFNNGNKYCHIVAITTKK